MALAKAAGLDAEDDAEEIELNPQLIKSLKRRLNQILEQPVINPLSSARYIHPLLFICIQELFATITSREKYF